jgi:hypothetical protein
MKITKAALVKLIKEEIADIQERVTPETIAMKGRLDEISQILKNFSGASFEIGQVYRQIKELMEAELAPQSAPTSAPSHAGETDTGPGGQTVYAKSRPRGN